MNEKLNGKLDNLIETWCGKLDVQFQILDSETVSTAVITNASYCLTTSTSSQQTTGSNSHDCSSKADCWSKINTYCRETESGGNAQANLKILEMIQADPVATLSITEHIETIEHAYVETCGTCHGSGQNRCTSCQGAGESHCGHCSGGRTRCVSCGGSGRYYVNSTNTNTSCTGCGGSGTSICGYCTGSGRVRCTTCSGSGSISCSSCAGTGYFTHVVTAQTYLSSSQTCQWAEDEPDTWVVEYLCQALNDEMPQAPLNETVDWDVTSFRLISNDGLPYNSEMQGMLESSEAQIGINSGEQVPCQFIGSSMRPYNLSNIFDPLIQTQVESLKADYSHDKAERLFNSRLAISSFDELNTSSLPGDLISWASMMSASACASLKQSLLDVAQMFDKMRSQLRATDLLIWVLVFFVCGMLTVNLLSAIATVQIPWDQIGLASFIAGSPDAVQWFMTELARGADGLLIPYMLITFIPAMLCLLFFGAPQTWSLRRMMFWYWGFSLFIGLFIFSFKPAFDLAGGQLPLSVDDFSFYPGVEWSVAIDVFLLTSLLAILKARRQAFNIVREEAAQVQSQALNLLLKYEARK